MTNNLFLYVLPKQYFLINCLVQRRVTTEMFSRGQICFADTVVRVLRRKKETKTKASARKKRHQTQKGRKPLEIEAIEQTWPKCGPRAACGPPNFFCGP